MRLFAIKSCSLTPTATYITYACRFFQPIRIFTSHTRFLLTILKFYTLTLHKCIGYAQQTANEQKTPPWEVINFCWPWATNCSLKFLSSKLNSKNRRKNCSTFRFKFDRNSFSFRFNCSFHKIINDVVEWMYRLDKTKLKENEWKKNCTVTMFEFEHWCTSILF